MAAKNTVVRRIGRNIWLRLGAGQPDRTRTPGSASGFRGWGRLARMSWFSVIASVLRSGLQFSGLQVDARGLVVDLDVWRC
jgi:hypothetical protein